MLPDMLCRSVRLFPRLRRRLGISVCGWDGGRVVFAGQVGCWSWVCDVESNRGFVAEGFGRMEVDGEGTSLGRTGRLAALRDAFGVEAVYRSILRRY